MEDHPPYAPANHPPRPHNRNPRREIRFLVFIAPVGVQTIFHHDKKIGVAEIATEIGVPYILSTAASSTIEEVAKANGNGRRWCRPHWLQDHETTTYLLHRAKAAGYTVLVITLDTWALA